MSPAARRLYDVARWSLYVGAYALVAVLVLCIPASMQARGAIEAILVAFVVAAVALTVGITVLVLADRTR